MKKVVVNFNDKYTDIFEQLNYVESVAGMLGKLGAKHDADNVVMLPSGDDHMFVRSFIIKKMTRLQLDIFKTFDVRIVELTQEEIDNRYSIYL